MGRPLGPPTTYASRAQHILVSRTRSSFVVRVAFIILLLLFFQQQHLYFVYRQSLSQKYSRTVFTASESHPLSTFTGDLQLQNGLLANRASWETLGTGWEGKTYKFNGSVIKTFKPGKSPFRNCMPGQPNERWPTEIPASLKFGGHGQFNGTYSGFLPVNTYFVEASSSSTPEWYMVTPLVRGGNTVHLSQRLRSQHPYKYFREVDLAYRPAFHQLLRTLEHLHAQGYCHDDIKPSNIFVNEDKQWILGDLGNMRHITHPYHSSRLWHDNHQLQDCRANDVFRALKSYLQFIRAASNDADAFDTSFLEGQEPLSRLFWWTAADASTMTAAELRVRSEVDGPEQPLQKFSNVKVFLLKPTNILVSVFYSQKRRLANAVTETLRTRVSEKVARLAAWTWLFGLPEERCRG